MPRPWISLSACFRLIVPRPDRCQVDRVHRRKPAAVDKTGQFGLDLLGKFLDRLGPTLLLEVHAVGVVLVAPFAAEGHRRVMQELVEPGAHEAVAAA
jgi:hypothetical protein